jgi:hypothetical protein
MAIQGNLKTPTGEAVVGATIRVVAKENTGNVIKGTMSEILTGSLGEYSFNLSHGSYDFEVKFQMDELEHYILSGSAIVDGNTPATITLPELIIKEEPTNVS